jgi:Na+-transporting methylmalonyl-CoA/oxaloacetate decarboxylase gamma subunit
MIDTFLKSLEIMGLGMASIFVFMLLFWLIIVGLQKIFPSREDEE